MICSGPQWLTQGTASGQDLAWADASALYKVSGDKSSLLLLGIQTKKILENTMYIHLIH